MSFTGFGASAAPTKASVFNFGATATTTSAPAFGSGIGIKPAGGLFGSTSTPSTGFSFGKTTTTTNSLGFGSTTGSTGFGTGATTGGFGFGKTQTGFGASTTTGGGLFGQKQPQQQQQLQQQQQQQLNTQDNAAALLLATATALSDPLVFGDERDAIMMKWNQIQAFWGTGKGYYRKDGSHIDFTPQNHFCRFKAVGFSCLPTMKDDEGFVSLVCGKKASEMRTAGEANIASVIHKVLGANANLSVKIDSIRSLPDDKSELSIYVSEQSPTTGSVRRVFSSELFRYIQQGNIRQQLAQQVAMETCVPRVAMSREQVARILANPPAGIDPVIWEQAQRDNPDPESLVPVPMIGFAELRNRLQHQELMAGQHQTRLELLSKGLVEAQQAQVNAQSKIEQNKRKLLELSHRVLQVVITQEVIRKAGYAIQPEEEQLRVHLDTISAQLNAPNQFRSRLNELLSRIRMHHHSYLPSASLGGPGSSGGSSLDPDSLHEIKLHLRKQQEGIGALVKIVSDDVKDLELIERLLATEDPRDPGVSSSSSYTGHYSLSSLR